MKNSNNLFSRIPMYVEQFDKILVNYEELLNPDPRAMVLWRKHLDAAKDAIKSPLFRVAIVGTVKAGKSTLINCLLSTDLLKRGAGIITAFITRIVDADEIGGWVKLKSWEDINRHIRSCLQTLPLGELTRSEKKLLSNFDIRENNHRDTLKEWLSLLKEEHAFQKAGVDSNTIVLSAYLGGFDEVASYIKEAESATITFGADNIYEHQKFVGKEEVAVYLVDMELRWPLKELGDSVEIGDCQGIDSPNPLHFSLVQDYLLKSHLITYLINTRIGLREADFKLLKAIEKLRLYPNTVFVLNVDLDSHSSLDDLRELEDKVKRDLSFLAISPKLFSFSSLFHLMAGIEDKISSVDRMRLGMWRVRKDLLEKSKEEYQKFRDYLREVVINNRKKLIVQTACSKLVLLSESLIDSLNLRLELSGKSKQKLDEISSEVENYNETVSRQLEAVKNMLEGLEDSLKKEIGKKVDDFFSGTENSVTRIALDAIDSYQIENKFLRSKNSDHKQMALNMYAFYLEFKDLLTTVLVEKVKLDVLEFAEELKREVLEELEKQGKAYWNLLSGTLKSYQQEFKSAGIFKSFDTDIPFAFDTLSKEIEIPTFDELLSQESIGRSTFMVKFSIRQMGYLLGSFKKKVLRLKGGQKKEDKFLEMLKEAVNFMKSEAKKDLLFSLQDYHHNFKFRYAYRLIEEYIGELESLFDSRIEMAIVETKSALATVSGASEETDKKTEELEKFKERLETLAHDLAAIVKSST